MTRAELIALGGVAAAVATLGVVSFHGSASAAAGRAQGVVKMGLADVTTDQDDGAGCNRWTAPAWEMARVGTKPLRSNHPLYRRPGYIGCNRHQVMCDNGWYYDAPENAGL